jgi:hypothetical protein
MFQFPEFSFPLLELYGFAVQSFLIRRFPGNSLLPARRDLSQVTTSFIAW